MSEFSKSLSVLSDEARDVYRRLDDADGELPEDLEAELNQVEALLETKIDNYDVRFRVLANEEKMLDERIKELQKMKKRISAYNERLEFNIINAMVKLGKETITGKIAEFKIKLAGGKAALQVDRDKLPPGYLVVETIHNPDNERIRKELEAGNSIEGCTLTRKWVLKPTTIGGKKIDK